MQCKNGEYAKERDSLEMRINLFRHGQLIGLQKGESMTRIITTTGD